MGTAGIVAAANALVASNICNPAFDTGLCSPVVPGATARLYNDVNGCRIADVVPAVTTVRGVRVPSYTHADL